MNLKLSISFRILLGAPSLLRAFTASHNIYFVLCSFVSCLLRFLAFLFFRFVSLRFASFRFVLSFLVSFLSCILFMFLFFCFHSVFISAFSPFRFALFIRFLVVYYLLSSHVSLQHFRVAVFASNRLCLVSIFFYPF